MPSFCMEKMLSVKCQNGQNTGVLNEALLLTQGSSPLAAPGCCTIKDIFFGRGMDFYAFFSFKNFIFLFIWLCRLSLVVASEGYSLICNGWTSLVVEPGL